MNKNTQLTSQSADRGRDTIDIKHLDAYSLNYPIGKKTIRTIRPYYLVKLNVYILV